MPGPFVGLQQFLWRAPAQPHFASGAKRQQFVSGVLQEHLNPRAQTEIRFASVTHFVGLHMRDHGGAPKLQWLCNAADFMKRQTKNQGQRASGIPADTIQVCDAAARLA